MLLLASLLVPTAIAEPLPPACSMIALSDTVPAPGAVDVPLDARPAVVFSDGCFGGDGWLVALTLAEDASEVAIVTAGLDDLATTLLVEVFPAEDLIPDTAYVLELTPDDGAGELVSVGFTTGTELVVGLTGEPVLSVQYAQYAAKDGEIEVSWSVKAATDPDVLSVLQLRDAEGDRGIQSFVVPASGATERTLIWRDPVRPTEVCPQVRQIDGAGVATEWSEPVCTQVAGCGGCAAGEGAGVGIFGVVAGLGMLVRRRGTSMWRA
ncbi:MAG: Ig-like domain-containing protein [Pseudomonadota bacterium]|nr:Ig-like domain-containing protein [Pseudomonadota bacterium]